MACENVAIWVRATAVAAAALLTLTPPGVSAADPFEINAILSITGSAAFTGSSMTRTLSIIEKQVNATGGIGGRPLHFVVSDDQSSPQVAVQIVTGLIAKHVPAIIGPALAATCRASMPLLENGPVMYCLSPVLYPPTGSYAFVGGASSLDETSVLLDYLDRTRGWKRIALITPTDATGQEADNTFNQLLARPEHHDLQVVDREHFELTDISVAAQIARIKESKPQAIIAWGTGAPMANVYRALLDAGVDLPVFGSNGNQVYTAMEQWRSILPRQYYQYALKWPEYTQLSGGPVKIAMGVMYSAMKADGVRPDGASVSAWDPAMIVVDAFRKLGTNATAKQVRDYILNLRDFSGSNGYYDFRIGNQRGLSAKDCIVVRWDAQKDTWVPVTGVAGK
jgi:branched-chain amino acid transport system substrate-binding protein